jgi:hypothetical protein
MSGRKQHFIPQVLLRQFAVEEARKTKSTRVWVYPAGREPYLTATEGVAAQRHFYSDLRDDGVETLDDVITKYEDRFARILQSISDLPADSQVAPASAAEIASHLAIRNAHLRHGVTTVVQSFADIVVETLSDNQKLASHLGLNRMRPGYAFDKYFKGKFEELPQDLQAYPEGLVRLMAFALARENIGKLASSQIEMLSQVLRDLTSNFGGQIRDLHNDTLGKGAMEIPHGFIAASPIEEWKIVEPTVACILPDCAAIGVKENGEVGPLFFSGGKDLRCIILPISTHQVLVGRSPASDWPNHSLFNELAAQSSDKFFVSAVNDDRMSALQATMGTASSRMFGDLIRQASAALDFVTDAKDEPPTYDFQTRAFVSESGPKLETYEVSFLDFGTEFPAQQVANEIGLVVSELKEIFPLDRLSGFTLAYDYERALAELDRGFEATVPLSTISSEFGRGLFRTPLVVRDGHPKFHVVARAEMAHGLIDTDAQTQEFYNYGLVRALANVGYSGLLEESSPGTLLGRFGDEMDGERLSAVDSALMCYFSCRVAAPIRPSVISDQIALLARTAEVSSEHTRTAVEAHWQSPDFAAVGRTAVYHASLLLDRLSEIAGTLQGSGKSLEEFSDLVDLLREAKLHSWFETFCSDLDQWWHSEAQWKYPESFMPYTLHFDRLTWALSLPLWKDEELGWQVFVPNAPVVEV